ncbi:mitogen-activated protein kinase kinase kinase 17-like [Pistacia vera]|uniref:mitogen-activated protein kinase kinase kinase 17-like n=1 Tax=Pistacia vera TaxID=55513 RepID=UPI0012631ED1|nr:mitogen-activated protein kinase kinase kinase 17-like [Pistacia vera]
MAVKTESMAQASSLRYDKQVFSRFDPKIPNVIKCYGDKETIGCEGEKIYNLFLEFCSGGSHYDYINKSYSSSNGLLEQEAMKYTRDIVKGLFYIHGNGIVHCDIKPGNYMLLVPGSGGGFTAKLVDFGLAKNMDDEDMEEDSYRGTSWEYETNEEILLHIGYTKEVLILPRNISENARDFLYKCFFRDFMRRWTAEELLEHPFLASVDS